MPRPWLTLLLSLVIGLVIVWPVAAYNTSINYITDGGTQFIYYAGSISGTFTHNLTRWGQPSGPYSPYPSIPCGDNGTYSWNLKGGQLAGGVTSYMRIGLNPPAWDNNPFYFSLDRGVQQYHHDDEDPDPPLPELRFATAHFECFKKGVICDDLKLKPWEFVPQQEVDLKAASVSSVQNGSESMYSIAGDDKSYVGNGTLGRNHVWYKVPSSAETYHGECLNELKVTCTKDTSFTYALNFTNTTASINITITTEDGVLSMLFSGRRSDEPRPFSGLSSAVAPDPGDWRDQYNALQLQNPADYPTPNFTYVDGKAVAWHTDYEGRWYGDKASGGVVSRAGGVVGVVVLGAVACLVLI